MHIHFVRYVWITPDRTVPIFLFIICMSRTRDVQARESVPSMQRTNDAHTEVFVTSICIQVCACVFSSYCCKSVFITLCPHVRACVLETTWDQTGLTEREWYRIIRRLYNNNNNNNKIVLWWQQYNTTVYNTLRTTYLWI